MLALFRKRYLTDPETLAALVALAHDDAPSSLLDPLLYLLAARANPLLYDSATLFLAPLRSQEQPIVTTDDLAWWLSAQSAAGRTQGVWSPDTITQLAQGLLSALRDFGVLEGKIIKRLGPRYLSVRAFALLAFSLSREYTTGERLLHADEWRLFFLDQAGVERRFLEAHTEGLDAIAQLERDRGFLVAQDQVTTYLDDPEWAPLPDSLEARLRPLDPTRSVAFLLRASAMAPAIYQMSRLLDEMQGRTRVPTILCYPGSLEVTVGLGYMDMPDRGALAMDSW